MPNKKRNKKMVLHGNKKNPEPTPPSCHRNTIYLILIPDRVSRRAIRAPCRDPAQRRATARGTVLRLATCCYLFFSKHGRCTFSVYTRPLLIIGMRSRTGPVARLHTAVL